MKKLIKLEQATDEEIAHYIAEAVYDRFIKEVTKPSPELKQMIEKMVKEFEETTQATKE